MTDALKANMTVKELIKKDILTLPYYWQSALWALQAQNDELHRQYVEMDNELADLELELAQAKQKLVDIQEILD